MALRTAGDLKEFKEDMMKKTKGQNVILEELQAYMSAGRSKEVSNSGEGGSRSENVGFQSILGNGMGLLPNPIRI